MSTLDLGKLFSLVAAWSACTLSDGFGELFSLERFWRAIGYFRVAMLWSLGSSLLFSLALPHYLCRLEDGLYNSKYDDLMYH